jgi:hypothetical protein
MQCKWQIKFKFHKLIMWVFEPVMTVSTASIPVLHSEEVVPYTHKSCIPCRQGLQDP